MAEEEEVAAANLTSLKRSDKKFSEAQILKTDVNAVALDVCIRP